MCPNRVEELEARVKELEASVEGLTDELVECKVRLRELESAVDEDIGFGAEEDAESTDEDVSESLVDAAADNTKSEGTQAEDNREESEADSGSDIIVA